MEDKSSEVDHPGSISGSRLLALALGSNNTVHSYRHRHHGDEDTDSCYVYRERERTVREKVGECLVSVTCTSIVGLVLSLCVVIACVGLAKIVGAIMFWTKCPVSPNLPVYLFVSGLVPAVFYITCRTRKKYKGAISGKQRILARWEFSVLHYTFDTEQSWQAGLAGVVCVFLTVWLCLGTALTVVTMKKVEAQRGICSASPSSSQQLGGPSHNASSSASSSLQSLSLLLAKGDDTGASSSPSSPPQPPPPARTTSEAAVASAADRRSVSEVNRGEEAKDVAGSNRTRHQLALLSLMKSGSDSVASSQQPTNVPASSNKTSSSVNRAEGADETAGDDVTETAPTKTVIADVIPASGSGVASSSSSDRDANVTDDALNVTLLSPDDVQSQCLGCDQTFLTLCFSLVLFDWAYFAALILNLVIVGTVPCCCFRNYYGQEV